MGPASRFISQALNGLFVPLYRATDAEFTSKLGPDGKQKVDHGDTAARNGISVGDDLARKQYGYAVKDYLESKWHGGWAKFNAVTGLDRWLGMPRDGDRLR